MYQNTINTLAQLVERKDTYTGNHTQRVTRYAVLLAAALDLPADQLDLVERGTPLHDIGKIGIDDAILRAPRRLTPAEFARMQDHTTIGADCLAGIAELRPIIPIVRNHHERWDGTGYPDRLAGEAIPLLARIVAVADSFDAMTSRRPYHETNRDRSPEAAFAEVERQAGRQFDPRCAEAFLGIRAQIVATLCELAADPPPTRPAVEYQPTPLTRRPADCVRPARRRRVTRSDRVSSRLTHPRAGLISAGAPVQPKHRSPPSCCLG